MAAVGGGGVERLECGMRKLSDRGGRVQLGSKCVQCYLGIMQMVRSRIARENSRVVSCDFCQRKISRLVSASWEWFALWSRDMQMMQPSGRSCSWIFGDCRLELSCLKLRLKCDLLGNYVITDV